MVAQPAGRADDDVGALCQRAALAPRVHAADAGDHAGTGLGVEPGQFALDLQRQFAGRRDTRASGRAGRADAGSPSSVAAMASP